MNRTDIHLLDLPVEILLKILKGLNNMDVLYSLIGVEGLDVLARDKIFTNTLNFVSTDNGEKHFINEAMLNRFCTDILPRIQSNVRCLVLKTTIIDRILRTGVYPNLTQLKVVDFDAHVFPNLCTDELLFRYNFKKQITDLTLLNNNRHNAEIIDRTTYVCMKLLDFFENLNHFNCIGSTNDNNPILSFVDLPSTTFVSSNLTKLSLTVDHFGDCLRLLDGRLNQLSSFTVVIVNDKDYSSMEFDSNDLPNLKCFSLTYKSSTNEYDSRVVPLLRRMRNLLDLTLHIQIDERNRVIDGIQLENDILIHLSKLQTFVFYIWIHTTYNDPVSPLSINKIEQSFSNVIFGQVGCVINHVKHLDIKYQVFSLPYTSRRIGLLGNSFTDTVFKNITVLGIYDGVPFEHEFFLRLARCFPLLQSLMIGNREAQSRNSAQSEQDNYGSIEIAQYLHLESITIGGVVHIDYLEQLLNELKTRLPCLEELYVDYDQLKTVTNDFTRDATRLNCLNVENLQLHRIHNDNHDEESNDDNTSDRLIKAQSKDFFDYFPSLKC